MKISMNSSIFDDRLGQKCSSMLGARNFTNARAKKYHPSSEHFYVIWYLCKYIFVWFI